MDALELDCRCCMLECDGPGHLDDRIKKESGLAFIVVRSHSSRIRASDLNAPVITNFVGAVAAAAGSFEAGLYVVGDTAVKYVAGLLTIAPALVVFEGIEHLSIPNCPSLNAETVWITRFSTRRIPHRGWATDCFWEAVRNDAVIRRRSTTYPRVPVTRELFFDVSVDNAAIVGALERGDKDLAVRAFPGRFEGANERAPDREGTGVCPICYETPDPRVTTACCNRDFCLSCAARAMGNSTRCPWCRRYTGLWNCSIEHGRPQAPFKDRLVLDLAREFLSHGPNTRVLIVTTDDVYTYNVPTNPLGVLDARIIGGSAAGVQAAMRTLEDGTNGSRVGVVMSEKMLCCGMRFHCITHVIFTETEAFDGGRMRGWLAACPNAVAARAMMSVYLLRMNDGRQFTDYTPRGSAPLPADKLPAHEAKNQMIAQADAMIAKDRQTAAAAVGVSLDSVAQVADVPGFEVTQMCDNRACAFASAEPVPGAPHETGMGTHTAAVTK